MRGWRPWRYYPTVVIPPNSITRTDTAATTPGKPHVWRHAIPWLLLSVRLVLAPILILKSRDLTDRAILWLYLLAFTTDYFDGVLARRLGTATALLRRADSTADTIFHLALAFVIFRRHPEEFHKAATALAIYLLSAIAWYTLDAFRWRRPAGFHAYSAKIFSIGLLIWIVVLFSGHKTGYLLSAILLFGAASNLEGIFISLSLKHDRADVPTLFHALRRRNRKEN